MIISQDLCLKWNMPCHIYTSQKMFRTGHLLICSEVLATRQAGGCNHALNNHIESAHSFRYDWLLNIAI